MPGPARAGLFIYACDAERIASFYQAVVGMDRRSTTSELIIIDSPDIQVMVHAVPPHIARTIPITSPPERREDSALKFFFTVPGLAQARETAASLGGEVFAENWRGPGFIVCNAMDPEGNLFQLREPVAP